MVEFRRDFKADYLAIETALQSGGPFCFVRFNDGEFALLQGKPYRAASGWRVRRRGKSSTTWLREPLQQALRANLPGYHVGISPPCCIPTAVKLYRVGVQVPDARVTFSTLFFNANYMRALRFFRELDAVLVSCKNGDYRVPSDGVNKPWDVDALVTELLDNARKPILLAAGPSACIIGHRYWERAMERQSQDRRFRPQAIIDVGATLDTVIHGQRTRQYHDASNKLRGHVCTWKFFHRPSGEAPANVEILDAGTTPRAALVPPTTKIRDLDIAAYAQEAPTPAQHRARVRERVQRAQTPGTGAWARQRVAGRRRRKK